MKMREVAEKSRVFVKFYICSREHSLASLFGTSVRLRLDYLPRL
jgi:hypothetical protein